MTVDAVRDRTKTVTRRHVDTWQTLKPGDRLTLIEKGMGLPKGTKQVVLAEVEVVDVRVEPIGLVTQVETMLEGFPEMDGPEFMSFWLGSHGYPVGRWTDDAVALAAERIQCRRIEWRYLGGGES